MNEDGDDARLTAEILAATPRARAGGLALMVTTLLELDDPSLTADAAKADRKKRVETVLHALTLRHEAITACAADFAAARRAKAAVASQGARVDEGTRMLVAMLADCVRMAGLMEDRDET
jgi:hypothetical protein